MKSTRRLATNGNDTKGATTARSSALHQRGRKDGAGEARQRTSADRRQDVMDATGLAGRPGRARPGQVAWRGRPVGWPGGNARQVGRKVAGSRLRETPNNMYRNEVAGGETRREETQRDGVAQRAAAPLVWRSGGVGRGGRAVRARRPDRRRRPPAKPRAESGWAPNVGSKTHVEHESRNILGRRRAAWTAAATSTPSLIDP